jgi:RNA polymerase sigma-70 factor (ECF subfamily)
VTLSETEFRILYSRLAPAVRARCRAICGNSADADEALQEAFLKAWRARDRFDGDKPLAWLQTIARNASLDIIRRRRPWTDDPATWLKLASPQGAPTAAAVDVARALDRMKPEDAATLRLRHAEGWRIHEIAEHLGMSQRSLRRRLARLEARAQALLGVPLEAAHAE